LRSGPNIKVVPGFDKREICLSEVRIENFHGFLFANLDPDAKPMDDWFPGARAAGSFVPHIADLKPLEWVEIPEACNWKVSVENYSECYHCSINHPTFATGVVKPETYDIQPQGHCLRHTTECQNLDRMSYPDRSRLKPPCWRLLVVVPVADVLVPGLSRQRAQHLSLAPARG
jgi:phenylpropionate dioxygenase-like ring-hydroxylating dioxygenase large terminal subunit